MGRFHQRFSRACFVRLIQNVTRKKTFVRKTRVKIVGEIDPLCKGLYQDGVRKHICIQPCETMAVVFGYPSKGIAANSIGLKLYFKNNIPGVNFINILRTNFSYKRCFSSFLYVHVSCQNNVRTKNERIECWWNWRQVGHFDKNTLSNNINNFIRYIQTPGFSWCLSGLSFWQLLTWLQTY